MQYRQWRNMMVMVAMITLWTFTPLTAQEMKGKGMEQMKGMGMEQMKGMGMEQMKGMESPGLPTPELLIDTFEKSVVVSDQAMPFGPLGMGKDFFGKLIAKVDFGKGVMFSVRKARILPGGDVGIMQTTEICYIEEGLGLLIDGEGKLPPRVVPAGSWFTVPTGWRHTLRSIGNVPLIMTVIRVGPPEIH